MTSSCGGGAGVRELGARGVRAVGWGITQDAAAAARFCLGEPGLS